LSLVICSFYYQIEVYDLLGNKVMELTGNTIDMEHLSSATYIVNALDLETLCFPLSLISRKEVSLPKNKVNNYG